MQGRRPRSISRRVRAQARGERGAPTSTASPRKPGLRRGQREDDHHKHERERGSETWISEGEKAFIDVPCYGRCGIDRAAISKDEDRVKKLQVDNGRKYSGEIEGRLQQR